MDKNNINIAIVGLGYVGLPLAVEFSKTQSVTCFDISKQRIADLKSGKDLTMEISRGIIRFLS